jgi:hypothetical protein
MNRIRTYLLAALIAAAPLSAAAQDRGDRGDRDRGGDRSEQVRPAQRRISVSEAQGIARSRARGATFVGFVGTRGDQYVFRFDRDGQLFDVAVSMTGR